MQKKLLIPLIAVGVLVLAGIFYLLLSDGGSQVSQKLPDHEFENWDAPVSNIGEITEEAYGLFEDPSQLDYDALLEAVRTGKVSLVSELWKLRRNCPRGMSRYDCNIRIRAFIKEKYPPPGGDRLAELLGKYLTYEETMAEYAMPTDISSEERYELIKQKRREVFGSDDANLVFGLEEAKYNYTQDYKSMVADSEGLSGDEKMERFEEMRKETLGPYYEEMKAREPKFTVFEREMFFREDDMGKLDAGTRTEQTHAIRVKYFGEDGAQRMAAVDQQIAAEQEAVKNLQAAEADYLKNNNGAGDAEQEQALMELRVKYLGQEEAEAYTRRQKYAEAKAKLREK